jgi:hypothetical protein
MKKLFEEFKEYENLWDNINTKHKKLCEEKRYKVIMVVDDEEYTYGTFDSKNRANEVAMEVRDQRGVDTFVEEE